MIKHFLNLWERTRRYKTEWVEDLPEQTEKQTVYIIGGRKHPFYAAVACPRKNCAEVIHLEISPEAKKRWKVVEHKDKSVSLSPSIYATALPCRCHYWFRRGRVVWCDSPPLFVPRKNRA
ncbi:MAG: hypothetical protein MPK34_01460 [Gammaproteobacteria bacterium]|nr:hypothetical protein [Gammaproteobacteria bacterium]MDA7961073.1 hypothetical protein [Gammaproteobacteria bacterium]MDA8023206.1 hypothetical protein [Gammaproteobacteria bacterium]